MSFRTTCRVGLTLLGFSLAAGCAGRELDRKPELAKEHGYYVTSDEARARGGVGNYVDVPSATERAQLNEQQAGIAANQVPATNPVPSANQVPPANQDQSIEAHVSTSSPGIATLKAHPETILFDTGDATLKSDAKTT